MSQPRSISSWVKQSGAGLAARLGLLPQLTNLYLYLRTRGSSSRGQAVGGLGSHLPLPPAVLRLAVAGTTDLRWFLESGEAAHRLTTEFLAPDSTVLDFGCGCGRVLRHMAPSTRARCVGADRDSRAVKWCRRALAPARILHCALEPPLPLERSERFDLIYAFSVFTHLPLAMQVAWLGHLADRLGRGGVLLISTCGPSYVEALSADEHAAFRSGEVVVRWPRFAGTNACCAYHPPEAVPRLLPADLEIVDYRPRGATGNPTQDLWVLGKRAGMPAGHR